MPHHGRNAWYRMPAMEVAVWGDPFDEVAWLADNPATLLRNNAEAVRASGLEIYLKVGDQDYINLHDGAEFMHRVLWDSCWGSSASRFARARGSWTRYSA